MERDAIPRQEPTCSMILKMKVGSQKQYLNYQLKSVPNMAGKHTGNYRLTVVIVAVAYFISNLHVKS
jgi:hypothetical protein